MKTTERNLSRDEEVRGGSAYPFSSPLLAPELSEGAASERPPRPPAGEGSPELWRHLQLAAALTALIPLGSAALQAWLPGTSASGPCLELAAGISLIAWSAQPIWERFRSSLIPGGQNAYTQLGLALSASFSLALPAALLSLARGRGWADLAFERGYFESIGLIITGALLAMALEREARFRAWRAVAALAGREPFMARRVHRAGIAEGAKEAETPVPVAEIRLGDRLRVAPGDVIPADGTIVLGQGWVEESALTGRAGAVSKRAGDRVAAGTSNERGTFLLEVRAAGSETLLPRIARRAEESRQSAAPIERRLIEPLVRRWTPVALSLAAVTAVGWWLALPGAALAATRILPPASALIAMLIATSPFALRLAARLPLLRASEEAAASGLLFRSAESLGHLGDIDTLVLNKTGILTSGRPAVAALVPIGGLDETDLLRVAALAEAGDEHPLAAAILDEVRSRGFPAPGAPNEFRSVPGMGVLARIGETRVAVGNQRLMESQGVYLGVPLLNQADILRLDEGRIVVFVAVNSSVAGLIGFTDPPRAEAAPALAALLADGIRLVLVTGDHSTTAHALARTLGIGEVRAELTPEKKAGVVRELRGAGNRVAVLGARRGDAIHPSPALLEAELGIALGAGTDAAPEDAAIVLLHDDLRGVSKARKLSKATARRIRTNLAISLLLPLLGVPVAAGALHPLTGALPSPPVACGILFLGWIAVILNGRPGGRSLRA